MQQFFDVLGLLQNEAGMRSYLKPIVMISDVFNMNAFNEHDNIILVSCNIYI